VQISELDLRIARLAETLSRNKLRHGSLDEFEGLTHGWGNAVSNRGRRSGRPGWFRSAGRKLGTDNHRFSDKEAGDNVLKDASVHNQFSPRREHSKREDLTVASPGDKKAVEPISFTATVHSLTEKAYGDPKSRDISEGKEKKVPRVGSGLLGHMTGGRVTYRQPARFW